MCGRTGDSLAEHFAIFIIREGKVHYVVSYTNETQNKLCFFFSMDLMTRCQDCISFLKTENKAQRVQVLLSGLNTKLVLVDTFFPSLLRFLILFPGSTKKRYLIVSLVN